MKRHHTHILLFELVLGLLFSSCNHKPNTNKELEALKVKLFCNTGDLSDFPIYADPPTADYEDMKKGIFLIEADSTEIETIRKYRSEIELIVIQYIDSGFSWVYLAAFLKYKHAVPKLKDKLLHCDRFYGWEGPDYSKIESYLIDDIQYCYQMAYIAAIEYISSKPLAEAVTLTDAELQELSRKANHCSTTEADSIETYCAARWLMGKVR